MSNSLIALIILLLLSLFSGSGNPAADLNSPGGQSTRPTIAEMNSVSQLQPLGIVSVTPAQVYEGPRTTHKIIASLRSGDYVRLLDYQSGWFKIRTSSNQEGWIPTWQVSKAPEGIANGWSGPKQVLGFYVPGSYTGSQESLEKNRSLLWAVSPFAYKLNSEGTITGKTPVEALNFAGPNNIKTLALIHNLEQDGFDGKSLVPVLSNSSLRKKAIDNIYNLLKTWGYSGVNIDFENLPPDQRSNFGTFMSELKAKLSPAGLLVTVSVPAKTSDSYSNAWIGAFDYAELARWSDYLVIMGYDLHSRLDAPGPISSVEWITSVLDYALKRVPADKIILGMGTYGYDWERTGPSGWTGRAISYSDAVKLAEKHGVQILWDDTVKMRHFSYYENGAKHEVWFEDRYSISHKIRIVNERGVKGIALWRLGLEDPAVWEIISTGLWR